MTEQWLSTVRTSYDTDADGYADKVRGSVADVVAFWSVIHVPDHAVPRVSGEFRRVLRPGGPLLIGFRRHQSVAACSWNAPAIATRSPRGPGPSVKK